MSKIVKPPISYLGGKMKLAKQINELTQVAKPQCFVDLFGGAGSILLNIQNVKAKVYNDLDSEIVNLYRVISNKELNQELSEWLDTIIVSREIFNEFKFQDLNNLTELDRAKRTIYLWKLSFSGRRNDEQSFSFGYRKKGSVTRLDDLGIQDLYNLVKDWSIENLDYKEIIKKYDDLKTLFFIDSPYYVEDKNTKYYKHNMSTIEDQMQIKSEINKIKGKVIITYPNTEFYRELYRSYNIIETTKAYSTTNRGNGVRFKGSNELIIKNF